MSTTTTTPTPTPTSTFPQVSIILDNQRNDSFSYTPSTWVMQSAPQWFNGSRASKFFRPAVAGTSVAFFGVTPNISRGISDQTFTYSIDGSAFSNTSFSDPNPPNYRQLFKSATLPDGVHTIRLSNLSSTLIDFAVVTVGKDTKISGERVIVDDEDSGLKYDGTWRKNRDKFTFQTVSGFTFGNSSHEADSVGNSVTYRFSGTAIAIYGEFDFSSLGFLTLTFSLDGQPLSESYSVTTSSPRYVNGLGQQPNFRFHSYDFLERGEHTLVVNVTECVNQTFRFDYLTYVPAFTRVSEMPTDLLDGNSTTGSGSSSGQGRLPSKAYAGIAVGVVLGVVIIVLGMFLCYRRKTAPWTKYSPLKRVTPYPPPNANIVAITQAGSSSPQPGDSLLTSTSTTTMIPYTLIGPNATPSNPTSTQSKGFGVRPLGEQDDLSAGPSSSSRTDVEPPSYEVAVASGSVAHYSDKP